MTLREAIDRFDRVCPNALPYAEKRRILSEFDGRLYSTLLVHYEGAPTVFSGYPEGADPDTELLTGFPFDDIYIRLLRAENEAFNGDIERYNNAAALFNSAYAQYADHINRTRRRKPGARIRC